MTKPSTNKPMSPAWVDLDPSMNMRRTVRVRPINFAGQSRKGRPCTTWVMVRGNAGSLKPYIGSKVFRGTPTQAIAAATRLQGVAGPRVRAIPASYATYKR